MTAREVLDGIKGRAEAVASVACNHDAMGPRFRGKAFRLAEEDTPRLTRAVEQVLVLHVEGADWGGGYCSHCTGQIEESVHGDSQYRTIPYPCPTLAAIENALNP